MKKTLLMTSSVLLLTGCTFAQGNDFIAGMQNDFNNAKNSISSDMKLVNGQRQRGSDSPLSLQDEIDQVKAEKARELEPINRQLAAREAQMRNIILNTKLSMSQKKAKTTLIQKDINNLKTQKENIEEKYRQKIREFRYN